MDWILSAGVLITNSTSWIVLCFYKINSCSTKFSLSQLIIEHSRGRGRSKPSCNTSVSLLLINSRVITSCIGYQLGKSKTRTWGKVFFFPRRSSKTILEKLEMFYLNTIEQLFLFVEQLYQLEVCLPYCRLLTGIPILAVFQNLRWNSNKISLWMITSKDGIVYI